MKLTHGFQIRPRKGSVPTHYYPERLQGLRIEHHFWSFYDIPQSHTRLLLHPEPSGVFRAGTASLLFTYAQASLPPIVRR